MVAVASTYTANMSPRPRRLAAAGAISVRSQQGGAPMSARGTLKLLPHVGARRRGLAGDAVRLAANRWATRDAPDVDSRYDAALPSSSALVRNRVSTTGGAWAPRIAGCSPPVALRSSSRARLQTSAELYAGPVLLIGLCAGVVVTRPRPTRRCRCALLVGSSRARGVSYLEGVVSFDTSEKAQTLHSSSRPLIGPTRFPSGEGDVRWS